MARPRSSDSRATLRIVYAGLKNLRHLVDRIEYVHKARVERRRAQPDHVGWPEVSDHHPTVNQFLAPRPGLAMCNRHVSTSPVWIGRTGQGGTQRLELVSYKVHQHGREQL